MKVPKAITVGTKDYVEIMTTVNLYIAMYGCKRVRTYLKNIPLRLRKVEGRNAGAYIVAKICQEYKITEYNLFNGTGRKDLTEARQMLCALVHKHLGYNHAEIAAYFGKTRYFAVRGIKAMNGKLKDNLPFDKVVIARYKKLDGLISAYMVFKPKEKKR